MERGLGKSFGGAATWRWGGLLVLLTLVLGLLLAFRPEPDTRLREIAPMRVLLHELRPATLVRHERYAGVLRPARRATLHFELAGQVVARAREPGERVREGDLILAIDDREYRARVVEAEAILERDRQMLELAERNARLQAEEVARLENLHRRKLASATQLDNARQKLNQQRTEAARLHHAVATDEARLTRARLDLEHTRLVAPFPGRVNRVLLDVGDYATRGKAAAEVMDDRHLELRIHLPGNEPPALEPGDHAEVLVAGRSVEAEIVSVQTDPDPRSYTRELRLRLPEGTGWPGQIAVARVLTGRWTNALAVPVSAVLDEEGGHFVFVWHDGRLKRRAVRPGPRVGDLRILLSGVEAGERVVARDVAGLVDGQRVVVADDASGRAG